MSAFFDNTISFLNELTEVYPDDADFSFLLNTVKLMKTTNPSLVVTTVRNETRNFSEKIMKKDESFFMSYSFEEYSKNIDLAIIPRLRNYISNMDQKSKDSVWAYIQNITRLAAPIVTGKQIGRAHV